MGFVSGSVVCPYCPGIHTEAMYNRGRRGRPYQRMVKRLRLEGTHVCWICGAMIDMSLPVNHEWAWTLDHRLPLIDYPCLGLDPANHAEAHRCCNSSKGRNLQVRRRMNYSQDW